ncbi:MAG: phytanoyl-CoA dioxygenase family protein [Acidimicrobiales bacterium]
MRHHDHQIDHWRREGAVVLRDFFTPDELAPVVDDMEAMYGHLRPTDAGGHTELEPALARAKQFEHIHDMPFPASPAVNLLGLHPALIATARAALGTDDVRLYQNHTWAKFTGQTDFDQPHHCDFKNHTLTVPGERAVERTINFMIYLTDVTDAHGAIHYVPLSASDPIVGHDRMSFANTADGTLQRLIEVEHSGAAPAGSVFAYGIDVYHRGTDLTAPGAHRFTITASYKAAGNDQIGWSAWPRWFREPWEQVMNHATPEQLTCLGVPAPGDPFWTELTLHRTSARWPEMDLTPYRLALRAKPA